MGVALTLTGCGSNGSDGDDDPGDDLTEETATQGSSYTEVSDHPGSLDEFTGALEDAELESCEAGGSGWIAEGTVTNPLDDVQSYRVYVSVRSEEGTIGLVQVNVDDVDGGDSGSWEADFDLDEDDLECSLRVERFSPDE